jgi:hypothetical protein
MVRANTTHYLLALGVIVAAIVISAACTQQAPVAPEPIRVVREKAADTSKQANVSDRMRDVLAKADQVDGTADKIVVKCAACDLAMDGAKEHALKVGEYTLLFCSDDCKQTFAKDLEKSVLSIKLPVPNQTTAP